MAEASTLTKYPPAYLARMKQLLGEEYDDFIKALQQSSQTGLRVNTLKINPADFNRISPFPLTPLAGFEDTAYLLTGDHQAGRHAYHAAGLYYLQDPSAIVAGSLLNPLPGELVLDLAAAPGGKCSHLAAQMGNRGLLVANDVQSARARILAQNLERLGVTNALICDETPQKLAQTFGAIFDRVLLDAPCSGESMFRRLETIEWSPAIVSACARRQADILAVAANLVRPGGLLAYATCAFSPEENEAQIDHFLSARPDFSIKSTPSSPGFDSGRIGWVSSDHLAGSRPANIQDTMRLWPHHFPGEGHFIALMCRDEGENEKPPEVFEPGGLRSANAVWLEFQHRTLSVSWPEERFLLVGNRLYLLPEMALQSRSLHLLRYGLFLGEARRGYFKPGHTLAMALKKEQVQHVVSWTATDPQVDTYLLGHDLRSTGPNGWVLVTVDGFPLGWGKRSNGRLKNHYPRGLRRLA